MWSSGPSRLDSLLLAAKELNAYALQVGAGGATGVVLRFESSAVEVETEIVVEGKGIQVLAVDRDIASHVLTDTVEIEAPACGCAGAALCGADLPGVCRRAVLEALGRDPLDYV